MEKCNKIASQKYKYWIKIINVMKNKILLSAVVISFLVFYQVESVKAQFVLDIESGIVSTGYNDVRIPGDLGMRFSLKDDLNPMTEIYYRLRAGYTIKSRHTLSILYAPLEIKSDGQIPNDVSFAGTVFPANTKLGAIYKFNSYRFTYRYDFIKRKNFDFGLGFTAKIRDARIALVSTQSTAAKDDLGFVPIINFRMAWRCTNTFGLLIDGDALAAKQGRAEDVQIAATCKISNNLGFRVGYRILEGGADNSEVYSFALFHYASAGLSITF